MCVCECVFVQLLVLLLVCVLFRCGMVESESFLDSTRRMVESWVFAKRGIVRLAASGGWNVIVRQMRRCCDWLAVAWRLKEG